MEGAGGASGVKFFTNGEGEAVRAILLVGGIGTHAVSGAATGVAIAAGFVGDQIALMQPGLGVGKVMSLGEGAGGFFGGEEAGAAVVGDYYPDDHDGSPAPGEARPGWTGGAVGWDKVCWWGWPSHPL